MERVVQRIFLSVSIWIVLVGVPSLAYGQNFGALTEETNAGDNIEPGSVPASEPVAAEPANEPALDPVVEETPEPVGEYQGAREPLSGPLPGESDPQVMMAPIAEDPIGVESTTVTVDPLSEENLQEVVLAAQQAELTQDEASRYTLGPTDIIQISVMRHPEVSGIYEINREGKIQYEFVGDIQVTGMTKDDTAKAIKDRLAEYIVNPEVTVKISGYNSKIVYVVGEVGRPGKIFMRGNTITVREALLEAGLPLLSGVTKKSSLITPSENGKIAKETVNIYALLYQGDLRENKTMNPGDVLYIPPTFLTKTMRAISPITQPISESAGTAGTVSGAGGL